MRIQSTSTVAEVAPVVLAAGAALRFGSDKLLAVLDGRPVLARVLEALASSSAAGVGRGVGVAERPDGAVAELLRGARLEVVTPAGADRGIGASLRAGIAALERRGEEAPEAALLVLGDQPGVRSETIAALVAAWRAGAGPVVRPRYAEAPDVPGHPVLLERSAWPLAHGARGDAGLRDAIAAAGVAVARVPVPGANPDVDTPADLERLRAGAGCARS